MDNYDKRIMELLDIKRKQPYFIKDYFGLNINVDYGVFPPDKGFFTNYIIKFLETQKQFNSILDMGSGTGAIGLYLKSINLARHITLCDVNMRAIDCIKSNCILNQIEVDIIHSDLFSNIPAQHFSLIVFNHPIFPSNTKVFRNQLNGGYEIIHKFLKIAKSYMNDSSLILMPFLSTLDLKHNPYYIGRDLNYNTEILSSENDILLIGLKK